MKHQQKRGRGNSGSRGQNFNGGEGRRAGQQPKSANKPGRQMHRQDQEMDTDVE